jgi:hypothetical protein
VSRTPRPTATPGSQPRMSIPTFSGGGSWAEPFGKTAHKQISSEGVQSKASLSSLRPGPLVRGLFSFRHVWSSYPPSRLRHVRLRGSPCREATQRSRPLNRLFSGPCALTNYCPLRLMPDAGWSSGRSTYLAKVIEQLSDAFESVRRHWQPPATSGLVEQQRWFARLRP